MGKEIEMGYELLQVDYDELGDYMGGRCDALADSMRNGIEKQLMKSFVVAQLSTEGLPVTEGGDGTVDEGLAYDEWLKLYWQDRELMESYGQAVISKAFAPWLSALWREWNAEVDGEPSGPLCSRH